MNKKNLLHIYTLLVCFFTTLVLMVSLGLSINVSTNMVIPQWKYYSQLLNYDSKENYLHHMEFSGYNPEPKDMSALKKLTPSQLDAKRMEAKKKFLEDMRGSDFALLISSLQWAFVALVFFFIHWRIYKRSKE